MKRLRRWLLDCLEALFEDDRNLAQRQRDHEDNQKCFLSYLRGGKR
jgi:hypothetical protein